MLVPNSFKENIANTFYDKDINIHEKIETQDAEGGRKIVAGVILSIFKGNVNFSVSKEIQEEYGLNYQIDVVITTNDSNVGINDLLSYLDVIYVVTDAKTRDSHRRIIANKYGKN